MDKPHYEQNPEDEWEDYESDEENDDEFSDDVDSDEITEEDEDDLFQKEPMKRPLRYSDECSKCPANRAPGYPHIINTSDFDEDTDQKDLKAADGIATFLWKWNKAQFARFFDFSKSTFEIHYGAPDGIIEDIIISRHGRMVLAGFRIDDYQGGKEWDPQVVFEIKDDGKWVPSSCSMGVRPESVESCGRMFAAAIFYHKLWDLRRTSDKVTIYHE